MNTKNILKKLISIKSLSGHEDEIQKYIFDYIKKYKLLPFYVGKNVVVKITGSQSETAIIFNSHVDTVSPGNLNQWKHNPFLGYSNKNQIFGLGASDEKASIAVSLKLIEFYSAQTPSCDLWFTFVVNEELDGSGTKEFLIWFNKNKQDKYKNIAGILGEPTNLETIEIGHKGNIFIKATVTGDSGHGSQPEKIHQHAIKMMYKFIFKLDQVNTNWANIYKDNFLGKPSISLTTINAGDISSPNKFADTCIASFDIRTTPKIHEKAFNFIQSIAKNINSKFIIELICPPASYGFTNDFEKIVKMAQSISQAKLSSSFGSNDMCFFTEYKIPAIVFGAGEPSCIHKPNEYCVLSNLDKCINTCQQIITTYGGQNDE